MTEKLLLEILRALQSIDQKLSSQGTSSVELKTSARGTDIAVKSYVGSDVMPAGDMALGEYFRLIKEVEERLMGRAA